MYRPGLTPSEFSPEPLASSPKSFTQRRRWTGTCPGTFRAGPFLSPCSGPWTRSQPAAPAGPALGGRVPGPGPRGGSPHRRSLRRPHSAGCSWVGPTVRARSHTGRETEAENGRSLSQGFRDSSTVICSQFVLENSHFTETPTCVNMRVCTCTWV